MPSRQEKKKAKRRAKYLKTRDDVLDSAQRTTKQNLKRSGPLNVKTIEQSLKRNGPLDAPGIEQILKRNGLLKDSDIAIVLNVHLARRKELRSLKGILCRTFTTSLSYQD